MLTDKQLKLIELVVSGDKMLKECLEEVQVPKSTYFYWLNHNKEFQKALDEAIEVKVQHSKKRIRSNIEKYINRLEKLMENGKNEQAIVNAIKSLTALGELDPQYKQEITIKKDESESKNRLLEMLREKKLKK